MTPPTGLDKSLGIASYDCVIVVREGHTRRACISCMPTRIQCVSYVWIGLSFIMVGSPVNIAKLILLIWPVSNFSLVGGVMTPPYTAVALFYFRFFWFVNPAM